MDCCRNCTRTNSFVLAVQEPPGRNENGQPSDEACPRDKRSEKRKYEDSLIEMIQDGEYDKIEKAITPIALTSCESNALLMGMKVSYELFKAAEKKGRTDKERFNQLAISVEKYTSSLLDPLRGNQEEREEFGDALDEILDEALQFRQKKFFTHPVIDAELKRKWYGRDFIKSGWENWRPLFTVLSVFDFVLCPILYALFLWKKSKVTQIYPMYMETPYFKFVRDTMSYIVLLVLHYALCVKPSTIPFSGLEWTIFIFFTGRCLVEQQQFRDVMERIKRQRGQSKIRLWLKTLYAYRRDLWNKLDLINLLVYLVILILRFATWISGGSVVENRVLSIAGYLYGLNTLCLTFRVFGHVMEQSEGVGTIQIALFRILKDVGTIVWQFIAVILAFSIATTKVYVVETSFLASGSGRNDTVCKTSGISCWWAMITHMGWSLLGASDEFDPMTSVDLPSVIVAQILYAGFLIMGVILLINMLIALLSNTYQRIEENSLTEWSFKRAATIQTYDSYDPIPVPLNILYCILKWIGLVKSKAQENRRNCLDFLVFQLDREYFVKHGNALPLTGEAKNNIVFQETERNRQMVNRILSSTFNSQFGGSMGEEAWQVHEDIQVQGALLTCNSDDHFPGARYRQAFCDEFPHFEVAILEAGKHGLIGIGVVNDSFSTDKAPGFENRFVGYYSDGVICNADDGGKKTEGPAVAFRGDCIRCTIMLDKKRKIDGKCQVTVLFTLNGMKVMIPTEGQQDCDVFVDYDEPLYPFIVLGDGCSVVAKMCSRDEEKCMESEIADLSKKVTEIKASLEETKDLGRKVTEIKASLEETKDLDRKVTEMKSGIEEANRKLNMLLQRLTDVSTQGQGER